MLEAKGYGGFQGVFISLLLLLLLLCKNYQKLKCLKQHIVLSQRFHQSGVHVCLAGPLLKVSQGCN